MIPMSLFNDINPWWVKRVKIALLIALAVFIAALLFSSCNPEKIAARKDTAAVNRVNASEPLQQQVVSKLDDAHPKDTSVKVSPPKTIYVNNDVLVRDTNYERFLIDSLKKELAKDTVKDCAQAAIEAYDLGYDQAEKQYLAHPVKVIVPGDTTITDHSEADRWRDSTNKAYQVIANRDGMIGVLNTEIKNKDGTISSLRWIITGILVLLALAIFFDFKKVIPQAISSVTSYIKSKT